MADVRELLLIVGAVVAAFCGGLVAMLGWLPAGALLAVGSLMAIMVAVQRAEMRGIIDTLEETDVALREGGTTSNVTYVFQTDDAGKVRQIPQRRPRDLDVIRDTRP